MKKAKKILLVFSAILLILIFFNTHYVQAASSGQTKNKEIFEKYYTKANKKMKKMKLDEKIAQLLLVRYPEKNGKEILKKYQFGGYIFFTKDFKGKTKSQIVNRNKQLQKVAKIPILTAVDEEGGSVVRISSNKKLIKYKFQSPMNLYKLGGFNKIKQDTIKKSKFLSSLGINLNLAPVVDVSTNGKDYMYKRTLGKGTKLTSTFAKTVISSSKGKKMSYTLKHFPRIWKQCGYTYRKSY